MEVFAKGNAGNIIRWGLPVVCILLVSFSEVQAKTDFENFNIGAILPLSGPNAIHGRSARQGIDLAVENRTQELRRKGKTVRIIYEDDQMDPEKGVKAANKLVAEDRVLSIIGPFASDGVLAVAAIAGREKVVLVSGSATHPNISDAGAFVFRTVSPDTFHGSALSHFAYELLRARKAAILYINNQYGHGLKKVVEKKFHELGGHINFSVSFRAGEPDLRASLDKIKKMDLHCVFLLAYPQEGGRVLKQAQGMGLRMPFLGGDGLFSQDLLEFIDDSMMDIYASAASWRINSPLPQSLKFVEKFKQQYGSPPDVYSAHYFDAVDVVLEAMAHDARTPEQIQSFLHTHEFDGVTGKIRFDSNGDVDRPIDIFKAENKRFEYFFTVQP